MKVLVPVGTRPEIIKMSPVVRALEASGLSVRVVATGQHYDDALAGGHFSELDLAPDERWSLDGSEAERVGAILQRAFQELAGSPPDLVVCLGDTYTVPLFCLAARRHLVPVAHIEAGLRSFNPTSMEEVNRAVAAATAAIHFAPTELAARFLAEEGVDRARVRVVGNPAIDVLRSAGITARPASDRHGVVVTAHRASNVDDPDRRKALARLVISLAEEVGPVSFPVHPRTRERFGRAIAALDHPRVTLLPPVPYSQMLELVRGARVVVTDSGGLQEEASWLQVPVVVLRRSTPRWEGVMAGTSVLTGMDPDLAVNEARRLSEPEAQARAAAMPCPYGDGHTSERIARILSDPETRPLLRISEPDFVGAPLPW